jgi:hypothetical protein
MAKVVPMSDAVQSLLAELDMSDRAPNEVDEMTLADENTSPMVVNQAAASHVAVTVQDHATVTPRKNVTAHEASPADMAKRAGRPARKNVWLRMGLQYTGASQVLLQLPMCIIVLGFLGSVLISYQPREMRVPVKLSSVSWCTNCLFISVPFLITALHYAAALHALEVAREITKAAMEERELAFWSDLEVSEAKIEGSRLGITAFSLYGLMPMMSILVFIGAMLNMGSSAATSKIQLTILALGVTALVLIVAGSVHVMVRGLLRRERDNAVNYVTFSLEPTFISLLCFQCFFAFVGMLKELTVPTAPGEPTDLRRRC